MTEKVKCLFCNEEFIPPRPWAKFCSVKCRNNYHTDIRYAKEGVKNIPVPKCPHCTNKDARLIERIYETLYLCHVCAKEFIWENQT